MVALTDGLLRYARGPGPGPGPAGAGGRNQPDDRVVWSETATAAGGLPMRSVRIAAPMITVSCIAGFVAACGSPPSPPPSPSVVAASPSAGPSVAATATPSPASTASAASTTELPGVGMPLVPGMYRRSGFVPPITFAVEEGWTVGTSSDGFFDVQQDAGTPDVIAVQFARVQDVIGADGVPVPATNSSDAVAAIHANRGLEVVDESASKLGGLEGRNVVVENDGGAHAPVLDVALGTLGIDPGRRLWISMFDTAEGVVAVMVGGSAARWNETLTTAEPVLESVVIGLPMSGGSRLPSAGDVVRIALDGDGPLGIDLDGASAWVVLTDSGGLAEVDLSTQQVIRTIEIGTGGQQVVAAPDGTVYVGRYATGGVGEEILAVDASSATVTGIPLGPIGGLALDGEQLWALEQTGEISRIDRGDGTVTSSVSVHVDQDAHMDLVAADGSAWVSGDRTPVHRISGPEATVEADIETGGGIPLAVEGALVWGARPDELWAIDPFTDEVDRRIALDGVDEILALDMDVDAGEAWIAVRKPGRIGAVIAVDLESGAVRSDTPVSLPAGVRLTEDRAWVTDYERDELVGIARP